MNAPELPITQLAHPINLALVMDACPITRAGICTLFSQAPFHMKEFIIAVNVRDISMIMKCNKVDIVIMELCGDGESVLDGLRMVHHLSHHWPFVPIIISATLSNSRLLAQLIAQGATGIYQKHDPLFALSSNVFYALMGKFSLSPLAEKLLEGSDVSLPLTKREIDVLECLFSGENVTATARALGRDIRTVSSHKRSAMHKLGFRNDCEMYTEGNSLTRNGLLI